MLESKSLSSPLALIALSITVLALPSTGLSRQEENKELSPLLIPALVKMQLSQQFSPLNPRGKFATDRFRLSAGTDSLSLTFANHAPAALRGKKFAALPRGYSLLEVATRRSWGSIHGFRSTGHNARMIRPDQVRRLTGAALSMPALWGKTALSGYFLQATRRDHEGLGRGADSGSQVGLTISRSFRGGFKLQSEWSQSWVGLDHRKSGQVFLVKAQGSFARAETSLSYRTRGGGFVSPAIPIRRAGGDQLALNVTRNFGSLQLQYRGSWEAREELYTRGLPASDIHQESIRVTLAPKIWPRLSLGKSWKILTGGGEPDREEDLFISMGRGIRSLSLGLSYRLGSRISQRLNQLLYHKSGISANATLPLNDGHVDIHYERTNLLRPNAESLLALRNMGFRTKLSFLEDRLSFLPAMNLHRHRDQLLTHRSILNIAMATSVKLPRYLPGTELLINFSSRRICSPEHHQHTAGLVVRWNIKPL